MTNTEASTTTQTAAVAETGANVAPEKPPSKKGTSPKKHASKALETDAVAEKGANVAPEKATAKKGASPKKGAPRARNGASAAKAAPKRERKSKPEAAAPRAGTAKAKVIAMMQRKGGATLDSIVKETGWQKHTVRGFISILGSKHGMKISSTKRESDGARVYSVD